MNRQEGLDAVAKAILNDRNKAYGSPEANFARTAEIMNVYLSGSGLLASGKALQSHDVAALMICLKLARLVTSPEKEDTWIDLAGYAVIGLSLAPMTPDMLGLGDD